MPRWPKKDATSAAGETTKAKKAAFSILVNEWDTAQGRFVERTLETVSQVSFNTSDGSQVMLKFAVRPNAPGSAIDVVSTTGSLVVHPIANNMIVLEGKAR